MTEAEIRLFAHKTGARHYPAQLLPRQPRLEFEQACAIV
jgi:hypothetical protein